MVFMSKENPEKKEAPDSDKKEIKSVRPQRRPPSMIEPYDRNEFMMEFDRVFDEFRSNFEDLFWPAGRLENRVYSMLPGLAEEFPLVDLEDKGVEFCLTVEVPGYKKSDVEIEVEDKAVEIRGTRLIKESDSTQHYVRRERASESFHRRVDLPEEVDTSKVTASMNDGVLELLLPKKNPKPRTKVNIK
jgi:HSP20 family protein